MQLPNKLWIDLDLQVGIVTRSVFPALHLLPVRKFIFMWRRVHAAS